MFSGFYFEYPYLLLIVFLFLACEKFCKMRVSAIYFPHAKKFMKQHVVGSKFLLFLKWLAIVMMIIAIASPVKDELYEIEPKKGYEIALVLDASESMAQAGFNPYNPAMSRFDVVKDIVGDFISKRKNDNIGIVVFGTYSFIASPLTYDKNILKKIVSRFYVGMAGRYTALYESIAQSVNIFKSSKSKNKIAILLTDGYNTKNSHFSLDVVLDMAKKEHIKIYPIGIGYRGEYNKKDLVRIAKETGGVAYGATTALELRDIYEKIDNLEKSEIKSETFTYKKYYYIFPLFVGFLSLMFYVYLRNKRGRN